MVLVAHYFNHRRMKRAARPLALNHSVVSDSTPSLIIPGLYLGSLHAAFNKGPVCSLLRNITKAKRS